MRGHDCWRRVCNIAGRVSVDAANVLGKVLLARETGAHATLAVLVGAEEGLFGAAVHLVHFALVAQEATRVGEALQFFAAFVSAYVGTVMFIHVFTVRALVRWFRV